LRVVFYSILLLMKENALSTPLLSITITLFFIQRSVIDYWVTVKVSYFLRKKRANFTYIPITYHAYNPTAYNIMNIMELYLVN